MTLPTRPRRKLGRYDTAMWEFVDCGELRLQQCRQCDYIRYPPGPGCPVCLSAEAAWVPVSGRGRVLSWATFHREYFPDMPVPYTVVVATLDEGPMLITDFAAIPDRLSIGAPVVLEYYAVQDSSGDEFTLYRWSLDVVHGVADGSSS